jgi:hypothetical protein
MPTGSDFARDIAFVPEVTFGTTPDTPTMKLLRFTGGFPNVEKPGFVSEEIRSDGQITDMRHGMRRVNADLGFELSYGAFDAWLEAALGGTWTTNVLKAGRTARFFTLEERHTDISQYAVTTGAVINSMSLNIQPEAMVTGSFGIIGRNQAWSGTSLGSPTAVASHPPFSGFTGTINEGGSAVANLTALELNIARNVEPIFVVGPSDLAKEMTLGQNVITGTATFLLESATLLSKFLNETESSLEVTLDGPAGGDLTISIPRLKYVGAARQRGVGTSLVVSMPFQALYSSGQASNIVITRIPA